MTSQTKATAPAIIHQLVDTFGYNLEAYRATKNETELRREFLDKFFEALGWDVTNAKGFDEAHKEVTHEFSVEVTGQAKKADYAFRTGAGKFEFLIEAKKPSVKIESSPDAAFQLRRYGWSAKLPVNILTDFEHFAVYDCTTKPNYGDKASVGRIKLIHYKDFLATLRSGGITIQWISYQELIRMARETVRGLEVDTWKELEGWVERKITLSQRAHYE